MIEILKLLRPKHWVKNLFLFIPLFFAGQVFNTSLYAELLLGFATFSLIASSIYIINDLKDIANDRIHPTKRFRPLAAGTVSRNTALILVPFLIVSGFAIALSISTKFTFIVFVYLCLNLAYTLGLKKISILDIIIVAIGFVLRVKGGSVITQIPLSQWTVVMVFLLALFIAIAKRRDDLVIKAKSGKDMRAASMRYNMEFLNTALSLISGIVVVAYLMFTLSPDVIERMGTYRLFYTSLFVIAGIFRYLQIALVDNNTGAPTDLLYKDRFIQIVILLWVLCFYLLIYFKDLVVFNN